MAIIKANIGLNKIEGARVAKDKTGADCVIIPVKAANIFVSDKGGIYLNLDILENKQGEDQYGNTHMIKLDIGQERRNAGEQSPIVGNCKTKHFGDSKPAQAAPQKSVPSQEQDDEDSDSIPF